MMTRHSILTLRHLTVDYVLPKEVPRTLQERLIWRLKGRRTVVESFHALRDISFSLARGEKLGVIGVNGSGKSTLLKAIAGIVRPVSGELRVNCKIAPLIELGTGFDMELTGRENIFLNASILGLSNKEIERRLPGIVAFSELEPFIHSPLKNYSSGMISRLAFAIAVEVDADLLLIDEVLSVGDLGFRRKCRQRMQRMMEEGRALIFVSHSMDEVQQLCDRALWLHQGRCIADGRTHWVSRKYMIHFDSRIFADVELDDPYRPWIEALFLHGIAVGVEINGQRLYKPRSVVTRAEYAVFLSRALRLPGKEIHASAFCDVPETHRAVGPIHAVFEQGLLDGVLDDRGNRFFRPEEAVSFREATASLGRLTSEPPPDEGLAAHEPMTRAELAKLFCRFFGLNAESDTGSLMPKEFLV